MAIVVHLDVSRGSTLSGFVQCGQDPRDNSRIVLVAIAGHPSHPGAVSKSEDAGEWSADLLPEYLESLAMLFAHKCHLEPQTCKILES